ncbi:MAG: response regulator [Fibrobacterota bacterium]
MARILLIDDDRVFLDVLSRHLTTQGHEVTRVEESCRCWEYLKYGSYDLLILDMVMPAPDGVDILRNLRALQYDIKVLAMSGGGKITHGDYFLEFAQAMGVEQVITKPIHDMNLLKKSIMEIVSL